jgi:hypothetical protein
MSAINFDIVVPKLDAILARGLSLGLGMRDGQMCIEAAICAALDLPHGDDPGCVDPAVRAYKIRLNDSSRWRSPRSRAEGLRDLGIAQLGSRGVIRGDVFVARLAEQTIRVLIPTLFREIFPNRPACLAAADQCEREGTREAGWEARKAADVAFASDSAAARASFAAAAATYAADAATAAAADAAAAAYAAYAASDVDAASAADAASASMSERYLRLSASLALGVLRDLKSPGALWLDAQR